MDPALLKERELFKKKALLNVTVESRKREKKSADQDSEIVSKKKIKKEEKEHGSSRASFSKDPFLYKTYSCLLYTSPSPRDRTRSRMPSSA